MGKSLELMRLMILLEILGDEFILIQIKEIPFVQDVMAQEGFIQPVINVEVQAGFNCISSDLI